MASNRRFNHRRIEDISAEVRQAIENVDLPELRRTSTDTQALLAELRNINRRLVAVEAATIRTAQAVERMAAIGQVPSSIFVPTPLVTAPGRATLITRARLAAGLAEDNSAEVIEREQDPRVRYLFRNPYLRYP